MFKALALLILSLVVVFFCAAAAGGLHGEVRGGPLLFGVLALLAGAYFAAGHCDWLPLFFIYGCIGSLLFVLVFCPVQPVFIWQAYSSGTAADWWFTIAAIACVIWGGVFCRVTAYWRHDAIDRAARQSQDRCQKCGYLLYGLPQPRCPECGTPFGPLGDAGPTDDVGSTSA